MADTILDAFTKCVGKRFASEDDPESRTVYYEIVFHIMSEYCSKVIWVSGFLNVQSYKLGLNITNVMPTVFYDRQRDG